MSEDDFLKRWSRRKREFAEIAKAPTAPVPLTADAEAAPAQQGEEDVANAEPPFDPATLPPIDSITAVSDVTAFLRAGVPAELTRAALRRVWTADPAIRDFVGLAENAWDFTDPNAMPGFGPLEASEDVRRMIAGIVDKIGQAAQPSVPEAEMERLKVLQNSNDSNLIESADVDHPPPPSVESASDTKPEVPAEILDGQVLLQSNKDIIATQHDAAEIPKNSNQVSRRPHGSALPR